MSLALCLLNDIVKHSACSRYHFYLMYDFMKATLGSTLLVNNYVLGTQHKTLTIWLQWQKVKKV